jgi:glycosyltransferase involved in cell wall biosynthesis
VKTRLLITTHALDKGGVEEIVSTYARFLDKRRYEVAVAYRVPGVIAGEMARLAGVRLFRYDGASKWSRFAALVEFARGFRPHLLHNHFDWSGLVLGAWLGIPRVETVHNTYHFFTPAQRIAYALLSPLVSRYIAVSEHVRRFTLGHFRLIRADRVEVIHNGIDVAPFADVSTGEASRRPFGLPPRAFVIGYVGRLEPQKDLGALLRAVRELGDASAEVACVLAGDGTLRDRLEQEARALGLRNVHFLGHRRDLPNIYGLMDVFVLPSRFEGLPVSVIEAMAAARPVVATRVGGVAELVQDRVTGILVDPGEVGQIRDALRWLIERPQEARAMGVAGRERVRDHFTAEAMIAKTERLYRSLLGRSGRP